jgi:hypothetical protein
MKSELRALPRPHRSSLPEFSGDGLLPPGDFHPSEEELDQRFGFTPRRVILMQGWSRLRTDLLAARLGHATLQLVDGSFTTAKPSPEDIRPCH